jgi:TonB family protein
LNVPRSPFLCGSLFVAALLLAQMATAQPAQVTPRTEAAASSDGASEGEPAGSESGPVIVAPEMVLYSPPVYPAEAFEQGLETVVQLKITVNADGSVTSPEVVESKGHGFDEAALAAALGLKFSPAQVNGAARTVRIGFEYVFKIEQAEEVPVEESSAEPEAPRVGEIGGTLLLSGTDTPLPGIKIVLTDGLGMKYEVLTDVEGKWLLGAMAPGVYKVEVSAEGFESVISDEQVVAGEGTDITFRIVPETSETEVVVRGERPPREVTRRVLERREIQRIPGTSGDALRSIQSLPGVARPPGLAGLLIVRGSAAGASFPNRPPTGQTQDLAREAPGATA